MANELNLTSPSGANIYAIIRRTSDNYVAQTTTSTFVVWNNANIANYDIALTDQSGDYYSADFPGWITSAGNYVVTYYLRAGGTPATTDDVLDSELVYWNGGAASGGPVGGNTVTIGECVTLLRIIARNAGISDTDDSTYELANKHVAIQLILEYLIRRTKTVTQTISDFDITDGDNAVTLAGITGFHTERLQEVWLDAADAVPLKPVSLQQLDQSLVRNGDSGKPEWIAFSATTGVGKVYPTPDDDYTGKVRWWSPLTAWTAGDTEVTDTTINVPADIARAAIMAGGIWALQKNQPQHEKIAGQSYGELQNYANSILSAGSLSARSFTRPEPD